MPPLSAVKLESIFGVSLGVHFGVLLKREERKEENRNER
jgi:hypothetical protein